jgi:hypothetical protein
MSEGEFANRLFFFFKLIFLSIIWFFKDPEYVSGTAILSIENIAAGSLRFCAHIISVFFNTAVTCYMLYMNYRLVRSTFTFCHT